LGEEAEALEEEESSTDLSSVIAGWQTKLLQLDRRNSLLYFRGKQSSVSITGAPPDGLFERLQRTRLGLAFPYTERRRPAQGQNPFAESPGEIDEVVVPGDLETDVPPLPLQRRLLGLYRKDREWEEEQGINVLFVALGFLNWIDDAGQKGCAPLLLAPADLERESPRDPWLLLLEDDDLLINETLRHKLRTIGITLPEMGHEKPSLYLDDVQVAISAREDWTVTNEIGLATFPFGKMAMWEDLEKMRGDGIDHPVVRALAGEVEALRPHEGDTSNGLPPADKLAGGGLDDLLPIRDQFAVLPADHSQLRAIELVRRGSHVVIHGPPGTGKSQTIANIMASLLADGKRVLFVSEKTAALDVVKRRLEECDLGVFCLDLHSDRARKVSVYEQLKQALDTTITRATSFPMTRLQEQREQLNTVCRALHEIREPLGLTVFEVHGRYARVRDLDRVDFSVTEIEELTTTDLDQILQITERIARRDEEFSTLLTSPWRALREVTWNTGVSDDLRQLSRRMREHCDDCLRDLTVEAAWLGVPVPVCPGDGSQLQALARHLSGAPGVPQQWLDHDPLRRLRVRANGLQQLQSDRLQLVAELRPTLGIELPNLDYETLTQALAIPILDRHRLAGGLGPHWESRLCPAPEQARERLANAVSCIERVQVAVSAVADGPLAHLAVTTLPMARAVASALREALESPRVPAGWTHADGITNARQVVATSRAASAALLVAESKLFAEFDESILGEASQEMLVRFRTDHRRFFRILTKSYRADMRAIGGCLSQPRSLGLQDGLNAVEMALQVGAHRAAWQDRRDLHVEILDDLFHDHDTDWEQIEVPLDVVEARIAGWSLGRDSLEPLLSDAECRDATEPRLAQLEAILRDIEGEDLLSGLNNETALSVLAGKTPQFASAMEDLTEALEVVDRLIHSGRDLWPELQGPVVDWDDLHTMLKSATRLLRIQAEEETLGPDLRSDFGHLFDGSATDWSAILKALDWTSDLLDCVDSRVPAALASQCESPRSLDEYFACLQRLVVIGENFQSHVEGLDAVFDPVDAGWDEWERAPFDQIEPWLTWIDNNADSVGAWLEHAEAELDLEALLGEGVLGVLRDATDRATLVPDLVLRRVYAAWLDAQYAADERLRFQPRDHEALREEFRKLDLRFVDSNRERVRDQGFGSYPDGNSTSYQYGQLGKLNHQLSLRRGQLSVRKLAQAIPQLLQALKPCLLMSPIAVSQYLPRGGLATDTMNFDVVVFDEASQIFPQDAVSAIARAKQVVVVGDQKQLPPTSFFRTDTDDGDIDEDSEDRLEGVESILDAMVGMAGTGVHRSYLDIHYRSRHEDLIRFSNHYFYDDRLLTFPSPHRAAPRLGVEDVYLPEARYDAGATRTNRAEAEEIVRRVFEIMRVSPHHESVGVVTLSRPQADLIEELINVQRLMDSSLDIRFDPELHERFFVKNLENVQGDERDHMLLSICYGPTVGSGAVPNRFGPINREGGERRLNVAVSRARRSFTVVRSIRPDQITSDAIGARLLRRYIEYAQDPERAFESVIDADPAAETESPFEEAVFRALVQRGLNVARQVGCFGYRIDLAISSEDGSRFDLGIECDGATYHSSPAARDRDWLRQQVLEGLGWSIHRIWSTDWIKNPEGQVDAVLSALEVARLRARETEPGSGTPSPRREQEPGRQVTAGPTPPEVLDAPDFDTPDTGELFGFAPYETMEFSEGSRSISIHDESSSRLQELLVHLVEVEGPVHEVRVFDVIRRIYGRGRAGRQIREIIRTAIEEEIGRGTIAGLTPDDGRSNHLGTFINKPGRPRSVAPRGAAIDSYVRSIEHIWPGEIVAGLLLVVESCYGIAPDEAITATARAFGFARVGPAIRESLQAAIDRLIQWGEIQDTEAGLIRLRRE
jgi:very-short-patch-repair endonuclease